MSNYFIFDGKMYGNGTVVQIYAQHRETFKFYSNIVFEEYSDKNNAYCFKSLYNNWETFYIPKHQLQNYIEKVVKPHNIVIQNKSVKIKEDCIEGMLSAWIWYILGMAFGCLLKGILNVIGTWALLSVIFFTWRHNKMKGE